MRTRLLRSTVAITLVAVVTLGIPLLLLARREVWSSAQDALRQQAANVAAGIEDQLDAGQQPELGHYADAVRGRRIVLATPGVATAEAGPALHGPLLSAGVDVSGSRLTVQAERGPTARRAREVSALVLGLILAAVAAAIGLALRQARNLTAPLAALVDRADALGRGDFAGAPDRSGVPEIDRISQVLSRSAEQLGLAMELQRQFASDAAHQLRTPLTGIGLHLDELVQSDDAATRREAEDALTQVERLDRVITALLARARGDAGAPEPVDLGELLEQEGRSWSRALSAEGRQLVLDLQPGLRLLARREHLAGALMCLLDNALQHGSGTVTVRAARVGGQVTVEVGDNGRGVPAELAERLFERSVSGSRGGTGLGLALARSLVAAEGGELLLAAPGSSRFVLTLPVDGPG